MMREVYHTIIYDICNRKKAPYIINCMKKNDTKTYVGIKADDLLRITDSVEADRFAHNIVEKYINDQFILSKVNLHIELEEKLLHYWALQCDEIKTEIERSNAVTIKHLFKRYKDSNSVHIGQIYRIFAFLYLSEYMCWMEFPSSKLSSKLYTAKRLRNIESLEKSDAKLWFELSDNEDYARFELCSAILGPNHVEIVIYGSETDHYIFKVILDDESGLFELDEKEYENADKIKNDIISLADYFYKSNKNG